MVRSEELSSPHPVFIVADVAICHAQNAPVSQHMVGDGSKEHNPFCLVCICLPTGVSSYFDE